MDIDFIEFMQKLAERSAANIKLSEGDYKGENGLIYCGKCHTPKQCQPMPTVPEFKPLCLCKCAIEQQEREEEERRRKEFAEKVKRNRAAGFPDIEMSNWTFANDDMSNTRITKAMQKYVEQFDTFKATGQGLLLYGEVGTGKTFAACEVANALIDKGFKCLVTNFSRVLNTLQGTFEKQDYIDSLNKYDLLVIDDLGIERDTEFAKEQVYNIIDARYRAGLPMIITTNLTLDKIKNAKDIEYQRIYNRVIERCHPVEVAGENRRFQKVRGSYSQVKSMLGL